MAVCRACGVAPVSGKGVRYCGPCKEQKSQTQGPMLGSCKICGAALRGNGRGACPNLSRPSHGVRVATVDVHGSTLNEPPPARGSAGRRRRRKRVTFAEEALHKKQKVIGRAPLLAVRDPERASHVPHRPDSITPLMAFLDGYYQGAAGGSMVPKCARVELVEEIGCQMLFG